MKRFLCAIVALFLLTLMLASCSSGNKIRITKQETAKIAEDMERIVSESNLEFSRDKILLPRILLVNKQIQKEDYKLLASRSGEQGEHVTYTFKPDQETYFSIKKYRVQYINVYDSEAAGENIEVPAVYKKYTAKDGKEFFVATEKEFGGNPNDGWFDVTLGYYYNDHTSVWASLRILGADKMTEKLARQIYNDFQIITLDELEKISK